MKTISIKIPQIYFEEFRFTTENDDFENLDTHDQTQELVKNLSSLEYDNLVGGERGLKSAIEEGYSKFIVIL